MEQEKMKNLCGLIPESLHQRLMEAKNPEMPNGEYLTMVLTAYLDQPASKQEQRTLAIQVSEGMFQQIKAYLADHKHLTQKAMVVGLIKQAIQDWKQGEEPFSGTLPLDNGKDRTLAFAVPDKLFDQVDQYLGAHAGMSKRSFLVGVVTQALQVWEMERLMAQKQQQIDSGACSKESPQAEPLEQTGEPEEEQSAGMTLSM